MMQIRVGQMMQIRLGQMMQIRVGQMERQSEDAELWWNSSRVKSPLGKKTWLTTKRC